MAWNEVSTQVQSVIKGHPNIIIAMPHQGSVSMEFVERTWKPLNVEPMPWCERGFLLCRVPSLPLARNILCKEFLKTSGTHLFWLDSDMLPPQGKSWNEILLTLYKSLEDTGESIVSGLYKAKQAHGFNYAMWKRTPPEAEKKGYMHVTNWTGNWIEVDVHGLGTCLMTRKVIEDISTKHGEQWFHWEEPDKPSEDFDFLEKAHGCGYKCWVRTDVVIEHEAKIVLNTEGQIRVGLV